VLTALRKPTSRDNTPVRIPVEFSLKSCHPIFFLSIEAYKFILVWIVMFSPVIAKNTLLEVPAIAVTTAIKKIIRHMKSVVSLDYSKSGMAIAIRADGMTAPNRGLIHPIVIAKITPNIVA
jgi:hypothetical protein